MKRTIATLALVIFIAAGIQAQVTYKFGHIDAQKLLLSLPESDNAQKALEAEGKSIQDQMEIMEVEYNKKVEDFMNNEKLPAGDPKKWTELVRNDKESEIRDLGNRIQRFQVTGNEMIQAKKNELFNPILEKVQKAIKDVAKENKFTYIFEAGSLLYFSDDSIDITSMVKAKLQIK
jgi:outer membrane protein